MKSNYKKLGPYIREAAVKNKDLTVDLLLGVSITKKFIPSIANTVGTDMSKYKIVKRNQFAYGPVTSRNGEKISVALLAEDKCIVSTSYTVFEIMDTDQLDPEYLMMWFRRSEFDRYARFMSHGSVREIFGWKEMCGIELPVPSTDKQREIVREYNVVNDCILLNEQLIQKLEDSAQAIYKQWFVDFEFPISKEYAKSICKPKLEGMPYQSSGGEMKYCEELKMDIPLISYPWKLEEFVDNNSENLNLKQSSFDELLYLDTGSITENHIESFQKLLIGKDKIPSRAKRKVKHNSIVYSTVRPNLRHYGLIKSPPENLVVSTGFCVFDSLSSSLSNELLLMHLSSDQIVEEFHSKGEMSVSTYPSIKPEDILNTYIPVLNEFFDKGVKLVNEHLKLIFGYIDVLSEEKIVLNDLTGLIEKNIINRA